MNRRPRSTNIHHRSHSRSLLAERLEDRRLVAVTPGWAFQLEGSNKEFVDDMSVDTDGHTEWIHQTDGAPVWADMGFDGVGGIYFTGMFSSTVNFGPSTPTLVSSVTGDSFVAKWETDGLL